MPFQCSDIWFLEIKATTAFYDAELYASSIVRFIVFHANQHVQVLRWHSTSLSGSINNSRSHQSFFHLLLNCLALESFGQVLSSSVFQRNLIYHQTGSAAYYYLTREQGKTPILEASTNSHFLAFFVSGMTRFPRHNVH